MSAWNVLFILQGHFAKQSLQSQMCEVKLSSCSLLVFPLPAFSLFVSYHLKSSSKSDTPVIECSSVSKEHFPQEISPLCPLLTHRL